MSEKKLFEDWPMKPIIILPPDSMSPEDINILRENHLCVVVAKEPTLVKFVDPIPSVSSRTEIENAAIRFSRILLSRKWGDYSQSNEIGIGTMARIFADMICKGTSLSPEPTRAEREEALFTQERADEICRIAREEARAERAALRAQKQAKK